MPIRQGIERSSGEIVRTSEEKKSKLCLIRLDTARERISELEYESIETSKTEMQREEKKKKYKQKEHLRPVG